MGYGRVSGLSVTIVEGLGALLLIVLNLACLLAYMLVESKVRSMKFWVRLPQEIFSVGLEGSS